MRPRDMRLLREHEQRTARIHTFLLRRSELRRREIRLYKIADKGPAGARGA